MSEGEPSWLDPEDDPDYISQDGVGAPPTGPLSAGSSVLWGSPGLVFVPQQSTPLDNESESALPRYALWPMKYLRGSHVFGHAEAEIRAVFGKGDATVYVIDDGRKHCLISRKVGTGSDGSTYCLVARITYASYDEMVDGARPERIFAKAEGFSLCFVYENEDSASNVTVVESYRTIGEVPCEYLPPRPSILFSDAED